jgi:hypothetical protein
MYNDTFLKSISKSIFILFILGIAIFLSSCKEESSILSNLEGGGG